MIDRISPAVTVDELKAIVPNAAGIPEDAFNALMESVAAALKTLKKTYIKDALGVLESHKSDIAKLDEFQLKEFHVQAVEGSGITWDKVQKLVLYARKEMTLKAYRSPKITAECWMRLPDKTKDVIRRNKIVSIKRRNTVVRIPFNKATDDEIGQLIDPHHPEDGLTPPDIQPTNGKSRKKMKPPEYHPFQRVTWHPSGRNFVVLEGVNKRSRVCITMPISTKKIFSDLEPEEPKQ